jgi:homoserine dehydrogenase
LIASERKTAIIRTYNLCLLGFGNVHRALVRLLHKKQADLRALSIDCRITGIASRRLGWLANPSGFDLDNLCGSDIPVRQASQPDIHRWLTAAQANVLFEATSLNVQSGQPAISNLRAALEFGAHAITANKGPVVHGYQELREIAHNQGKHFLFESAVMDGAPIFSLFRELPAIQLKGFRGILNSTTNLILTEMENGMSFESSVKKAQELGLAETDPANDTEGWDASVKVAALVTVLMGVAIKPQQIRREGITRLKAEEVRAAREHGRPFKLICRAQRTSSGVETSVGPEQIPLSDPLSGVAGTSSAVYFETDVLPGLAIVESNPSVETTAYGMLADFLHAVR